MTDIFDRLSAALAERYTIERELGAGGMATVYLAHDVKHDRKVAVKVLRPQLAAVLGTERFLNEIKVTANLSHPHILPLLDSGRAVGREGGRAVGEAREFLYYVMPFVEGESLRDRLEREKQLSIEQAVEITKSVASALDYAHRHNVIHRDIKPENILLHDGQPVVADFGISLALSAAGGTRLTETGLSLGTPHYMSPEQAAGDREIDGKSDIYSLGCVLYEMLAGDPPHTGSTVQAVIAATVSSDPIPISQRRRTVPNHVVLALHQALEKVPADRFESAGQFAEALGAKATRVIPSVAVGHPERNRYVQFLPWLVAAVLAVVLGSQLLSHETQPQPLVVTAITPPPGHRTLEQVSFAISPDGSRLAFATVSEEGNRQLWLRPLDTLDATQLAALDGEGWPFWSPDGNSLGFFAEGRVWTLDLPGGARRQLCDAAAFRGGAWSPLDTIVFAAEGGLWRTDVNGGGCQLFITDTNNLRPGRPTFLPDGRKFLYTELFGKTLWLGDLPTGEIRSVSTWPAAPSGQSEMSWVQFALPDYLVFGALEDDGAGGELSLLRAARFDLANHTIRGDPVNIIRGVRTSSGVHSYAVSSTGSLVFTPWEGDLPPVTLNRDGTRAASQIEYIPGRYTFAVAHEHPWLFLGGDADIWKYDRSGGISEKLRTGRSLSPVPGPGDSLVAFSYWGPQEECTINVFNIPEDRVAELHRGRCLFVTDWSADGRHLLLDNSPPWMRDSIPNIQIWQYSFADSSLSLLVARDGDVRDGVISPDGRWVAYSSDEAGTPEVYVRRFAGRDGGVRISRTGGRWPRWGSDGRELYYLSPDGAVNVADMTGVTAGQAPARPRVLFRNPAGRRVSFNDGGTGFTMSPDGLSFFFRPQTQGQNIALVQNWPVLMERR